MKFTCNQQSLAKALNTVSKAVSNRTTIPILKGIMIKATEEGSLILSSIGPKLVLVTLGSQGVFVRYGDHTEVIPGFRVKVADTNGAGDTFLGAMLAQIAGRDGLLQDLSEDELRSMITYANKAASLTCSRHGAIPAMPYASEME